MLNAIKKLVHIIKREGTAHGERLKPYYIKALIQEEKVQRLSELYFDGVRND